MSNADSSQPARAAAGVGGVVVTFHPDAGLEARLAAVAREVDLLVLVDNSADPAVARRLAALSGAHGFHLVANAQNLGLGAALNLGFSTLVARGFDWAIAFDQDSTPEPGLRSALLATAGNEAAVVGANWHDEARPEQPARHLQAGAVPPFFRRTPAEADLAAVTCVITSGSLFDLTVWRALGGFDAGLFLDLVDTDFCLRAGRAGHAVRVSARARLRHRRGQKRPVRFLGRTWWPAFMPAARLYYLFRNRLLLLPRAVARTPHWVAFELIYGLKIIAEIVVFEDRKPAKLAACLRGTWDGLLGVSGPDRRTP